MKEAELLGFNPISASLYMNCYVAAIISGLLGPNSSFSASTNNKTALAREVG